MQFSKILKSVQSLGLLEAIYAVQYIKTHKIKVLAKGNDSDKVTPLHR